MQEMELKDNGHEEQKQVIKKRQAKSLPFIIQFSLYKKLTA